MTKVVAQDAYEGLLTVVNKIKMSQGGEENYKNILPKLLMIISQIALSFTYTYF